MKIINNSACIYILIIIISERPAERLSDESSKKADSDSHPENWTDSDPQPVPSSSPPKSTEDKKVMSY